MARFVPHRVASLLSEPDYRRIWAVGAFAGTARWLEMLVFGVFAFEVTGSPFLVALAVMIRLAPLALFGLLVGILADRFSPRTLLVGSLAGALLFSLPLLAFLAMGLTEYWIVVVASAASGVVWTVEMPLRRRMLGDIAGTDRLVSALSLEGATTVATRMLGPLVGGSVYQLLGVAGAYSVVVALYALAFLAMLRSVAAPRREVEDGKPPRIWSDLRDAVGFAIADRDVLRILLVTIVYNVWGLPFLSMIPVIGEATLHLSPAWIGLLASLEGAGAFLGAMAIAISPPPASLRRFYYFGALGYVVLAFVAGWMTEAVPMAIVVFCIGLSLAGFSSMQSALIYTASPPHMRNRLFGLMMICIGTGLIGVLNMGLMGEWFGGATAVRIVAAEGIILLAVIGVGWTELRSSGSA